VCCSRDGETWFRVAETAFDSPAEGGTGALRWALRDNTCPTVRFAYFPPYSLERQQGLVAKAQASGLARVVNLGTSCDGRDIPCLVFGAASDGAARATEGATEGGGLFLAPAPGKAVIWIQGRQHPGEVAASWFVEGAVERLLELAKDQAAGAGSSGGDDGACGGVLAGATVFVVPNLNPDGGKRGHLRTNAQVTTRVWGSNRHFLYFLCLSHSQLPWVVPCVRARHARAPT
jgi:murein tripeptide amidase MpaA